MRHARCVQRQCLHLVDDLGGAVEAGGVRQLGHRDQVLLVLPRDEAAGHAVEQLAGGAEQYDIQQADDDTEAQQLLDQAGIAVGHRIEGTVERCEQPATEQAVDDTGQPVRLAAMRLEQQGGERR